MRKTGQTIARGFFSLVILVQGSAARAEWVEWLFDGNLSGRFDSNINRSYFTGQQRQDYTGMARLSAGRAYQLGEYTRAYATAEWTGEQHVNYQRLNQYSIGGKALLTHKFGLGLNAPLLSLDFSGAEIYSDSRLRSGEQITTGLRLSVWCNELMQSFIGYRFDDRNAPAANNPVLNRPNSVFDVEGHALEVGSILVMNDRLQWHTRYSHRWGDIVSNNLSTSVPANLLSKMEAIAREDAYAGWTYRAPGTSHIVNVGLSYALLDGHAATALDYTYQDSDAVGMAYQSHQVQLSVYYSY